MIFLVILHLTTINEDHIVSNTVRNSRIMQNTLFEEQKQ